MRTRTAAAPARRRLWRRLAFPLLAALVLLPPGDLGWAGPYGDLEIRAHLLPHFGVAADKAVFGQLRYVGGFSYRGSDRRLEGVSAIRLSDDGTRFVAVTDTGYWFTGRIERDREGRPTGLADAALMPILSPSGAPQTRRKGDADAEGLALGRDRLLVSFERNARIMAFDRPADFRSLGSARPTPQPQPIPPGELRSNAGIETIANSPVDDRSVIVTEQSLDANGNLFAAILGPGGGLFRVKRDPPWHVTDGAFLPGSGDLLLLERRFEGFGRVGMRIRRIAKARIAVGALADGPVLMEADLAQEIDNMEGLDARRGADGRIHLTLVSDDNGSFFQRQLFLEFVLLEGEAPSN